MKELKLVFLFVISFLIVERIDGSKILAVEFFGSKSHVFTYLSLLEELAAKGHNVTLLSPVKGFAKPTIKEIQSVDLQVMINGNNRSTGFAAMGMIEKKEKNIQLNPFNVLTQTLPGFCRELYDREDVKALMEEDFDLLFIQPLFNECGLGFVHKVMERNNAPLILFIPTSAPNFFVDKIGGHHPPSFVSNMFLGLKPEMTFFERMKNAGMNFVFEMIFYFRYLPVMEDTYRSKLGSDIPSSKEILQKASLILSNSHFSLSGGKPNLPNVVDVGGIHSRPAKPLPEDLEDFVAGSGEDGFILFSFGTGIKSSEMSEAKRGMFLNVFSKLKQRVIWKYEAEADTVKGVPKNVLLVKWMPQQDLLGHPKIRLFISHSGLGGTEEAIYHGVPIIGIPFYGDQLKNAKEGENLEYLLKFDWNELTEENLLNGIHEVIGNPKYRSNIQRISKVFRDQIDNPLQRGVWWVEYVLRHKGAPQLQSAARKLNYFQYHSLDVIGAYLLILFLFAYVPYRILKYAYSKCCTISKKVKNVKINKKKVN